MSDALAPGLYPDMSRAEYDALDRVNFSTLKSMARSPAHYFHGLHTQWEDTPSKKLGRAVHLAVLEPARFAAAVAVWSGGTRRGAAWEAFRVAHAGQELLTEAESETCAAIQAAVRSDPLAGRYVEDGATEVTMIWATADGVQCKGRIDLDSPRGIVDLKTTRNSSPSGFGREVWSYLYHAQAAWYQDGYERITGTKKPYWLVAVESAAPYVAQVYSVPDAVLNIGRESVKEWLAKLAWCHATCQWPGYLDTEAEIELPRWATFDALEDDISTLDLNIPEN